MSDLIISRIENAAVRSLKTLWLSAFPNDPEDYVDGFFTHLPRDTVTLVGECDGEAVTMLFLLPAEVRFCEECYPVRYLYAGCTHPQYRGRGYYRELLDVAAKTVEQMGEHAIYLHPADELLTQTYQRLGYYAGICNTDCHKAFPNLPKCSSIEEYLAKRHDLLERVSKKAVIWSTSEDTTRFFIADAVARGAKMSSDSAKVMLLFGETIIETFTENLITGNDRFCLWLPISTTPLLALMQKKTAFTGLVGD